jgi:small subunit ribosomal protein S11
MKKALENASVYNISEAKVRVAGVGAGRESAVRAIGGSGIKVTQIKDVTPVPHNGCRRKKTRRV